MDEIEEIAVASVVRLDYRHLSPICNYCKASPKIIRIAYLADGELRVSALCTKHAHGERDACTEDLVNIPGTGTYLNPKYIDGEPDDGN